MIRTPLLLATLAALLAACSSAPASPSPTPSEVAVATPTPTPTATPIPGICDFEVLGGDIAETVVIFATVNQDGSSTFGDPADPLSFDQAPGGLTDPAYLAENRRAMAAALERDGAAAGLDLAPGSLVGALGGWNDQPKPSLTGKSYAFGFARNISATLRIRNCPDLRDPAVVPAEMAKVLMRSSSVAYLVRQCSEGALTREAAEALFSGRPLDEGYRSMLESYHAQSCG